MGCQAWEHAAPHSIVGGCNPRLHLPGHIQKCCPSQRCPHTDMDMCAHGTTADTLSHTPWHGQGAHMGRGLTWAHTHPPGVYMQHHGHCKGSIAAPANQLWHATPTRHTPTQTAFFLLPTSRGADKQTHSQPCISSSLLPIALRAQRGWAGRSARPLCLDFPEGWAVLGQRGELGTPKSSCRLSALGQRCYATVWGKYKVLGGPP